MIIVRLMGGLGNQMFQYAVGRNLALSNSTDLKLDISHYSQQPLGSHEAVRNFDLDVFNINGSVATNEEVMRLAGRSRFDLVNKVLRKVLGPRSSHFVERTYLYDPDVLKLPDNTYLDGYFQTEKYFCDIEEIIRTDFTFKDEMSLKAMKIVRQIDASNSVCVHVRRTDFLTNSAFGVQDVDYFERAEKIISSRVSEPKYFVFSDDIEWCQHNLSFQSETIFVDEDFGPRKFRDDLRLMVQCKNYIISNSSFAWWAVWLNQIRDNIVIAPKTWVQHPDYPSDDLIPLTWLRV
jgi:hypothetical protein